MAEANMDEAAKDAVLRVFRLFDKDGDGAINRQELASVLQQLLGGWEEDKLDLLLDATDTNEDGRIQLEEFLEWLTADGRSEAWDAIIQAEGDGGADSAAAGAGADTAAGSSAAAPSVTHAAGGPSPSTLPLQAGASATPGQLYTWGRGSDGQLGQDAVADPAPNCALPHPVPGLAAVVQVACGGGQQGSTAAVTADGALFTFGNNFHARLGHGEGPALRRPRRVEALRGEFVLAVALGAEHGLALVRPGSVFSWGGNRHGELGLGSRSPQVTQPAQVALPAAASIVDCDAAYSAALLEDGSMLAWGSNEHGRLGCGDDAPRLTPHQVPLAAPAASISLGSLYAGAVGHGGELWMWGYGGHGNLGLGSRRSYSVPQAVPLPEPAAQVACTRGQDGCKGGLYPKQGGQEGPHTVVVAASGALYTMGTCHKGLLMNLGSKDGAFGKPWDELRPFRVGSAIRNGFKDPPVSSLAIWPPPYDRIGPAVGAVSGHIHAVCLCADGRAWAWGCGSNDGRCGVERYVNMKGDGKPKTVDSMKCYLMGPHPVGIGRPPYWTHGPSLEGARVLALATGRNHMACIAVPA